LADVGIDEVHSVSGLGTNTTFLTGDTRYQLSRDWGIGSVANISRTDGGTAWSVEGYLDHLNAWGTGRTQADFAKTQTSQDVALTLNQRRRRQWTSAGLHRTWAGCVRRWSIHHQAGCRW
jgi:hypothetical protein